MTEPWSRLLTQRGAALLLVPFTPGRDSLLPVYRRVLSFYFATGTRQRNVHGDQRQLPSLHLRLVYQP